MTEQSTYIRMKVDTCGYLMDESRARHQGPRLADRISTSIMSIFGRGQTRDRKMELVSVEHSVTQVRDRSLMFRLAHPEKRKVN